MLPRLEAEERLAAISDRAIAAGTGDRLRAHQSLQRLQRAARAGQAARVAKATPAVLKGMGIAVRTHANAPLKRD